MRPTSTHQPAPDPTRLTTLATLLRATAADLRSAEPPPRLPAQRVAEVLARAAPATLGSAAAEGGFGGAHAAVHACTTGRSRWPGSRGSRWLLPAGLLLAAAALLVGLDTRPSAGGRLPAALVAGDTGTAFLPVRGAEWPGPATGDPGVAWLVEAELPRERLALLGLPFDPARAGDRVPAELLLNPDGEVIAVRLVR